MAVKQILVGKAGSSATPLTLIKGDSNTQIIEMIVERYYGGVDLAGLAWSVTVENANGASDEYRGIEAIANGTNIAVRWKTTGTATAAVGLTKFKLSGYAQDGSDVLIWQSGDYFIRVNDTFEYVPGAETQAELTGVQKLIIYVDGELNKVIKAGTDAAEAAKAANAAADRANSVADGKNEGRITALEQFTTKPGEPYAVTGKLVQLDNFEGMPMNAVTRIEPVQAGSGEPSPSNIRPISGRTGAKLTKCGKNLLPNVREATETYGGITFTNHGDGSYTLDGTATTYVQFVDTASFWLAPGTYVLSGGYGTTSQLRSADGLTTFGHSDGSPFTFNVATEVRFRQTLGAGSVFNGRRFYPQLELGSTATEYTPYQGETFSASFGQTVYGGTLDWGKGVLTVDRAIVTLAGTENSVERNTTENAHYIRYNYFGLTQSAIADGAFCSHFKTRLNTDVGDQLTNTFEIHSSILYQIFRVSASLYPTDDVWKSYLAAQKAAGTPVQVCYKLANPTTIQLTPAQLTALQGMNNIFCDAGETTVSGRKDILWLTSGLIEQIDTLKKAIISLGGNV